MPKVTILGNFRSRFSWGRRRVVGAGEFEVCGNPKDAKRKGRCGGGGTKKKKKIQIVHWENIGFVSGKDAQSEGDT